MPKYVVLYRFTTQGATNITETVKRARQSRMENERRGFKTDALLWTQGPYDLVAIINAPSEDAMMGAMMNIVGAGNVSSTTMRAFDENEMGKVIAGASGGAARAAAAKPAARPKARARKK
ncbi:MAG: GYD domain-containing protein [Dehalococcoidia bacterium]